jgi:GST-like protein
MTYTLYGWHQTGSVAIEAALREAGAAFRYVPINTKSKEHEDDRYRAVNPRQQLPTLTHPDGTVITEIPAILLHIADTFPKAKLAPSPGSSARAAHDRWLMFFAVNVYEGELRKTYPDRYTDGADQGTAVATAAEKYVQRHYSIFEQQLENAPYFLGAQLSVLDIYVWMLVQWMDIPWLELHCPKIMTLAKAVIDQPKINPVHADHFGADPGTKP